MASSSSSLSTYELCSQSVDSNLSDLERQNLILQCIANSLDETNVGVNTFFLIYAASLVFYMQTGFALLCAGYVRTKNVQNTLLKNFIDACGASLGFYTVGYAFAFGGNGSVISESVRATFVGTENFFLMGVENKALWLFQYAFSATSTTIVAGSLAERGQMLTYLLYSTAMTAFVYPVVAHSIWDNYGFLSSYNVAPFLGVGVVDFAGSLVVHVTGGLTALIAAKILGPRKGRFYFVTSSDGNEKRVAKNFSGHSIALQTLGTLILWFCWYGFNTGSVSSITSKDHAVLAQNAAISTTLAASSGALSALMANAWLAERETGEPVYSLSDTLMGCLSGLVSSSAGCAYVSSWASIAIGFVSGILYLVGTRLMIRFGIDDVVNAIPIHLLCGMWGSIAVGLFADSQYLTLSHPEATSAGLFFSNDGNLLACQICGILFVLVWVTATMTPFFCLLYYLGWLRSDSLEEILGLDVSYSGLYRQNTADGNTPSAESNNDDDEERLFYERKHQLEQMREQQRSKVRRRLLMMDLTASRSRGSNSSRVEDATEGEHNDSQNGDLG